MHTKSSPIVYEWRLYLGGDNAQAGARWNEARVHATLRAKGINGATLIPCVGIWQGEREGSWCIVVYLPRDESGEKQARELAHALAVDCEQHFVSLVTPLGEVQLVS